MNSSSQRILFTLMAIFALAMTLPAHAQQFGHAFEDGGPSSGLSGDYKRGSKFALTEPGVLNMMKAFIDGKGGPQTGYQNVAMDIYRDASGVPGVKLWESAPVKIQAQSEARWYEFYTSPVALPPGSYWLVIHSAGTTGGSTPAIARDFWSNSANNWYGNADTFSDGASSPFGAGGAGAGELLIQASYLRPDHARFAGRATVAATPSAGLASDFKRGSRFTLSELGRVFELSAYVDGKGGGTGTQKLRYDLYQDLGNGTPGQRILESDEVTINAGQSAGWVSAHVTQTDVQPGNYWIVIHTGNTTGVARDYGDGPANWYGTGDSYSDGASTLFGNGSAGTVTISATAMYIPGNVMMGTVGNNSQSGAPSSGLSANFSRGGKYSGFTVPDSLVTAFWAYLDGNGGGTGSQQVRVAFYVDYETRDLSMVKQYESQTVTIPAGMPAQWVRFPLKAPVAISQNPAFWLMLQSGDNAGVVRDYGDPIANWWGFADTYADGATPDFYPYGNPNVIQGTVELSVKLDYTVPGP